MFLRNDKPISLDEVKEHLNGISKKIETLIYRLGYDNHENIQFDRDNFDENFLVDQYIGIADKLEDVQHKLDYLSKPIRDEGILKKNSSGRYSFPSGIYLTSGSSCEILCKDEEGSYWIYTTIEHSKDYYATKLGKDVNINGMVARIR